MPPLISFPVLPLRNEMYAAGQRARISFERPLSKRAARAAFASGRLAVIAQQKDPAEKHPTRQDLYEQGMLVEIEELSEDGERQLSLGIHVLRPVKIVSTHFNDEYLQMYVADEGLGHGTGCTDLIVWLPEALRPLYIYLSQQLRIDLDCLAHPQQQTELSMQNQVSRAIQDFLLRTGTRMHFVVSDNEHMSSQRKFSDVLVTHATGRIAVEVKKKDTLQPLLDDVSKLKSYLRGQRSDVLIGVLVFPMSRELASELVRAFRDDPGLILVGCASRS